MIIYNYVSKKEKKTVTYTEKLDSINKVEIKPLKNKL